MQCNHSNDPYLQYLCTDDGNHVHDCVLRMIVYENSVIVWPAIPMVTGAAILTNRAPPPSQLHLEDWGQQPPTCQSSLCIHSLCFRHRFQQWGVGGNVYGVIGCTTPIFLVLVWTVIGTTTCSEGAQDAAVL